MALGEFEFISRYFSSLGRGESVELGVGDDAAILALQPGEQLVTSVDTVVAGRHFPAETKAQHSGRYDQILVDELSPDKLITI